MVRWAGEVGLQSDAAQRLGNDVLAEGSHQAEPAGRQSWEDSGEKVSKYGSFCFDLATNVCAPAGPHPTNVFIASDIDFVIKSFTPSTIILKFYCS